MRRQFFPILLRLLCASLLMKNQIHADEAILDRPVAVAVSSDGSSAFIGNQRRPSLTIVDTKTMVSRQWVGDWNALTDLAISPATGQLLIVSETPPQIMEFSTDSNGLHRTNSSELPGRPAKLALSLDGKYVCVSMTWNHAVLMIELENGQLPTSRSGQSILGQRIELDFQPKELLPLSNGRFLVADAFGGCLAVVDCNQAKAVATHKLLGHHIGGLARDDSQQTIAISHQRLSANARTTRDDIHWGLLIQSMVSVVPESLLSDPTANIAKSANLLPLSDVGRGAADPSGLVARNGNLAVAISGTNQIAFLKKGDRQFRFTESKQPLTRVANIDDSKMLWISPLGNTASITGLVEDSIMVTGSIGTARIPETAEERGEIAFFSGQLSHDGWMSCSSCHVDGHSPDLVADTKGDGRFDNAKRIPSLFNVASTGPWSWKGSEANLENQIEKTIATSMQRNQNSHESNTSDRSIAKDIEAYLSKLKLPEEIRIGSDESRLGQVLFESRGCASCHKPETNYTSTETYNVNVSDELGQNLFNPPSLEGLRYRRAYFHDARYKSLSTLIANHPDTKTTWTPTELAALKAFLMRL